MNNQTSGTRSSVLDVLLTEVFHAYRQGLLRRPQFHVAMPPRDFGVLKFLGTIGWLRLDDRLRLRNLHLACDAGLAASRQGCLTDALAYYERAQGQADLLEESRPAWLLAMSTYQSGAAYLDFRRGCIEEACKRLDNAMDADLELEHVGLPVMQMHRIQQGHNLARMDLRLRQREKAIELAGILLAYMEGRITRLPYHRDWNSRSLQAIPRSLQQAMIQQIIGETAGSIVTGKASVEEWSWLVDASRLCENPEAAVFPQVQYALRAQSHRLTDDIADYLCDLERFFRFGVRHCPLLWYAVMVELVDFCEELGTRRSYQVREIILRDSDKLKGLPSFLRDRMDDPQQKDLDN